MEITITEPVKRYCKKCKQERTQWLGFTFHEGKPRQTITCEECDFTQVLAEVPAN